MTFEEYIPLAVRTEAVPDELLARWAEDPDKVRLLHAVMGLNSEIFEIEQEEDLAEELGDLFWYLALAADTVVAYEPAPFEMERLEAMLPDLPNDDLSVHRIGRWLFLKKNVGALTGHVKAFAFYDRTMVKTPDGHLVAMSLVLQELINRILRLLDMLCPVDMPGDVVRAQNIAKLEARYPKNQFNEQDANDRADKS